MFKSKIVKVVFIGMCITMLSSGVAFAQVGYEVPEGSGDVMTITEVQPAISEDLQNKQSEIDEYIFKLHAKEIEEKGFTVTHTGTMDSYVEIGITPYNEENAEFLYGIFDKEMVKVVEGQQAMPLDTGLEDPDASVSNTDIEKEAIRKDLLEKQDEVNKYVFEQNSKEIEEKGFTVTHTAPLSDHVEIGITPYSEANAEFIYGIVGKDMVKVVEGELAELMENGAEDTDVEVDAEAESNPETGDKEATEKTSFGFIALLCTIGAVVVGGAIIGVRKLRTTRG